MRASTSATTPVITPPVAGFQQLRSLNIDRLEKLTIGERRNARIRLYVNMRYGNFG